MNPGVTVRPVASIVWSAVDHCPAGDDGVEVHWFSLYLD
jgi:hypothetical protein